ncbi:MAG: hypothetical protein LBS56_08280 [Propionibacteriaceae bacterium]|jgi:NitT/TauT family transport system substrate-binding protein|nr:hypothetical protein [Propionibacteriaceae bacterium]
MKKLVVALLALVAATACAAPSSEPTSSTSQSSTSQSSTPSPSAECAETTTASVAALKGPTGMGLAELIDGAEARDPDFHQPCQEHTFTLHGSPDEITPNLVNGSLDLAAIPANLAAVLHNKTDGQIQLAAVNTLGVLHVVAKNETVTSLADLAGKTVWSTGKGTTPEYVVDYLLERNGLAGQVSLEYLSEASEVAARLAAADSGIAVLPEPYVTTVTASDPAVVVALDLTAEWTKVSPNPLVTGVLVVQREWAQEHPAELEVFLGQYGASVARANADPGHAAAIIAELGIVPSAAVAEQAIPRSHLSFLTGAEAAAAVRGYLEVLHAANPQSVGGSLPGDDFYLA